MNSAPVIEYTELDGALHQILRFGPAPHEISLLPIEPGSPAERFTREHGRKFDLPTPWPPAES